jgi:hypothetical protein
MASLRPCIGCIIRNECGIRSDAMFALRGTPITSARLRCDIPYTQHFPPGTRIWVTATDHRGLDNDEVSAEFYRATVSGKSSKHPGKLLVQLDERLLSLSEREIEFMAVWPKDVHKKIDEPLAALCPDCKRRMIDGDCNAPECVEMYNLKMQDQVRQDAMHIR